MQNDVQAMTVTINVYNSDFIYNSGLWVEMCWHDVAGAGHTGKSIKPRFRQWKMPENIGADAASTRLAGRSGWTYFR